MTISFINEFPSTSITSSKDVIREVIDITVNNVALTTFNLKALRGTSRDIEQVISRAARRAVVSEKYPLEGLNRLTNLASLRIYPEIQEQYQRDLVKICVDRQRPTLIRTLAHYFQSISILTKGAFKAKQIGYRLNGGHAHDANLHHLQSLTNLVRLDLKMLSFVTDIGLSEIGKLSQLQQLSLAHCPNIFGKGLLKFGNLHKLRSINLSGQIPADLEKCGALDVLKTLPELEDIKFGNLLPSQIEVLADHEINPKITAITAHNLKDQDLDNLVRLTKLRYLELVIDKIDLPFQGLQKIDQLIYLNTFKLQLLSIYPFQLSQLQFYENLSNLPNLRDLTLAGHCKFAKNDHLKFPRLECLSLGLKTRNLAHEFHSYSQLKTLKLAEISTADGNGWPFCLPIHTLQIAYFRTLLSLVSLRNLPNLKSLNLSTSLVPSNFDMSHLADLQHLESLDMSFCSHSLRKRDELQGEDLSSQLPIPLPNLQWLDLSGCKITKENFDFIAKIPKLTELNLTQACYSYLDLNDLQNKRPNLDIIAIEENTIRKMGFWRQVATITRIVAENIWWTIKNYFLGVVLLKL